MIFLRSRGCMCRSCLDTKLGSNFWTFSQQISSSPLPSGPTPRRLSVSTSIGGETGLLSCVLPEEMLVQILADRIQVRPHPCMELQGSHTFPRPCRDWALVAHSSLEPRALERKDGFPHPHQSFTCPFDRAVSPWPWLSLLPEGTHFKGPVIRRVTPQPSVVFVKL